MHTQIKYFVYGHTAEGFVDFLQSNIKDIKKTIILRHPSNKLKTTVINRLAAYYEENNDIELLCSPQGNDYLDGIIIRNISLAIIAEPNKGYFNKDYPIVDITADFPSVLNTETDHHIDTKIDSLQKEAYYFFETGLTIHNDLEEIFINKMDFAKADAVAEEFIQELFNNEEEKERTITVRERLFGTNTPDGVINQVEQLIEPINNCIFIKGRAGTGKSFFMRKVLKTCERYGFDVEMYRCSFDPNSIDMLIIRDLDYCLFDSTAPHEFFPTRKQDKIIDLYEKTVTPGTDEKYFSEINRLTKEYKAEMKKGLRKLEVTKELVRNKEMGLIDINKIAIDKIVKQIIMVK